MEKLKNGLILMGILFAVSAAWQALELFILGYIAPDSVDTLIGIILTCSLYFNLQLWDLH